MSPGSYGMSEQAAKVKPRPEPLPQDPGGRFRGTYAQGPSGNDAWRWCAFAIYPPSTPGRQQSSPWTEETEWYPGSPWPSEEDPDQTSLRAGTPEISSSGARRRPCSSRSPSCYVLLWRTAATIEDNVQKYGLGNTWPPTRHITVPHCDLCSRLAGLVQ